jgi:hypothetical protein
VGGFKDDLTGREFTRWTVLRRGMRPKHWLCRCVCGEIREVLGVNLRGGYSRSCGCLPKEHSASSKEEVEQRYVNLIVKFKKSDHRLTMAAFRTAQVSGKPIHECYLAAVKVIQSLHSECSREYAGKRAVEIILESRMVELAGWKDDTFIKSKDEEI